MTGLGSQLSCAESVRNPAEWSRPSRSPGMFFPLGLGPDTQLTRGGSRSSTVTLKAHAEWLPAGSLTPQTTMVTPFGKTEPDGGTHAGVSGPAQISDAVA